MADVVGVDELAAAIDKAAGEYTREVTAAIPGVIRRNAQEARRELMVNSPLLTGSYSSGWTVKKTAAGRGERVNYLIYNKTDYQLTHLLEFGHAKRDGGRVSAIPHIAPVAEQVGRKLSDELGQIVVNGGAL